jgi:hypothetical protein
MFTTEELQAIDRKYFTVIMADAYDVTLISNNTRHVWYIHNVELKDRNLCLVYHNHKISHPYHSHSRCGTLRSAIRDIKSHDELFWARDSHDISLSSICHGSAPMKYTLLSISNQ